MKKWLAAMLALTLLIGILLTPAGASALTDIEYKRSLAAENIEIGADAIGMFLRAEYVGYVFVQPRKDARNIGKTVNASRRVCLAVEEIRAQGKFETMPAELRETARLRTEHPEANLVELAAMHSPPITKSGLNHRLQKIILFAENL